MVELREHASGTLWRSHGGDTLNTAVYLARLGVAVDYVTALGDDGWSDEMVAAWQAEGVGVGMVRHLPGTLPGLYIIQTDPFGERRFLYWRDSAAARMLFDGPDSSELIDALSRFDLLYFSGITLSIYGPSAREALFSACDGVHQRGGRVAFDTNFRPRGWPDRDLAAALFRQAFSRSDIVFASQEDLTHLFGAAGERELAANASHAERVLKLHRPAVQVALNGTRILVEAEPVALVIDTTAAGDSFAAAYLAGRLAGQEPAAAARTGHRLAGAVIGHPGAIIPAEAMPALELHR